MFKNNTEDEEALKQKLAYIGLNLEKIPKHLNEYTPISFKPTKVYENTYKIYKHIDVTDIQILLTPTNRLVNLNEKYKLAAPISSYLDSKNEENIERFTAFLKMLSNIKIQDIEEIDIQQKQYKEKIPYTVKYQNNYMWQIFYSDISNQYFMLVPTNEINNVAFFYLLKKQIEAKKNRKKETIFVPISHLEYSGTYLTRTQITDLENYLWYFTKDWPNIFEVYNLKNKLELKITGTTKVYENINSFYSITLENKDKAIEQYKLVKALFVLATAHQSYYKFSTSINEIGELEFIHTQTNNTIKYNNLYDFVQNEINNKDLSLALQNKKITEIQEELEKLKIKVEGQMAKFAEKQKEIATFLECKKSFLGKVKYYFYNRKKSLKSINNVEEKNEIKKQKNILITETLKNKYTIEDLIEICTKLEAREKVVKKLNIDIKAMELKLVNLERKIKNANIYLNEIDLHKKSIFEFWKFSNKDELPSLNEGEEETSTQNEKIVKSFDFVEDIEELGKKVDDIQRRKLSKNETDAVYAIKQALYSCQILNKLKKDSIEEEQKTLLTKEFEELQKKYVKEIKDNNVTDFDIFGNIFEEKTKIINNTKHRETEKDKYKILNINSQTELSVYIDNLRNYLKLVKEAFCKVSSPYNMSIYLESDKPLNKNNIQIFNLNENNAIKQGLNKEEIYLYKVNIQEGMPMLFYSNIIFFDNINNTLPVGMDLSDEILVNLNNYTVNEKSSCEFRYNYIKNEFENSIINVKVIEYDAIK